MAEPSLEIPKQLVVVVLASPGDAHGFLYDAHSTGHDAYPESDPKRALKTLRTQVELYGGQGTGINAVVVDITRLSGLSFFRGVRIIDRSMPIIAYSSNEMMAMQLRTLATFNAVDSILKGAEITPERVLNAYPQAINQRRSRTLAFYGVA